MEARSHFATELNRQIGIAIEKGGVVSARVARPFTGKIGRPTLSAWPIITTSPIDPSSNSQHRLHPTKIQHSPHAIPAATSLMGPAILISSYPAFPPQEQPSRRIVLTG